MTIFDQPLSRRLFIGLLMIGLTVSFGLSVLAETPLSDPGPQGTTIRVSVSSSGEEGNDGGGWPSISADGRYVAFMSQATNLVPTATNGRNHIFVHDSLTGQTELVSVNSSGEAANGNSWMPFVSAFSDDGRFVIFSSLATNLADIDGDTGDPIDQAYIHDRETGDTSIISLNGSGEPGNGHSFPESISADGRYVVITSDADNLVPDDTNGTSDVFVYDRITNEIERISVSSDGVQGNQWSSTGGISADGRYIVFPSSADNLVAGDTNNSEDIFVHDRETGETRRVSISSSGEEANGPSPTYAISADGRYVAFSSWANNLVEGDTNEGCDIFVHDLQTGQTERVSISSGGEQSNGDLSDYEFMIVSISADGRYVAFSSDSDNLVAGDTNNNKDIFVHDRQNGVTERVSIGHDGAQSNDYSAVPSISADGRYIAFQSQAENLVPGDTNDVQDIFVRDRGPLFDLPAAPALILPADGATIMHPRPIFSWSSVPGAESYELHITTDPAWTGGETITVIGTEYPWVADLPPATYHWRVRASVGDEWSAWSAGHALTLTTDIVRVSVSSSGEEGNGTSFWHEPATISADGRFIAFVSTSSNLVPGDTNNASDVFVYDRLTGMTERVSVSSGGGQNSSGSWVSVISADGNYVVFSSYAGDLVPDGVDDYSQLFVHNRLTDETEIVSVSYSGEYADGYSSQPAISADGRYVAFASNATNLVPDDTNGISDVFVRDRLTGMTERVSVSSSGEQGNGESWQPSISADGRYVAFSSDADNLVPGTTYGDGYYGGVFVHDRHTGQTEIVSVSSDGELGNNPSCCAVISGNGRYVVFHSFSDNLVDRDNIYMTGMYIHDRDTGEIEYIPPNDDDGFNTPSSTSSDGRYIAFHSYSSNLVPGDINDTYDAFIYDRQSREVEMVSVSRSGEIGNGESWYPTISDDGRYVVFVSEASNLVPNDTNDAFDVFVRDRGPIADPPPPDPQLFTINEQELLAALRNQAQPGIKVILVIYDTDRADIYMEIDGFTGIVPVRIDPSTSLAVFRFDPPTNLSGQPAPASYVQIANTVVPGMLVGALDALLAGHGDIEVDSMQIRDHLWEIWLR